MAKTIGGFTDGGGRVIRWPKKRAEQLLVLEYLGGKFQAGREYREKEVNAILDGWHAFHDFALLRRELVERGLLRRTPDCRSYWAI